MPQYAFPQGVRFLNGWQKAAKPTPRNNYLEWPVYRQTLRKAKPVAFLYLANIDLHHQSNLDFNFTQSLLTLYKKVKKRSHESLLAHFEENLGLCKNNSEKYLEEALINGWLTKWVRVKEDGITILQQDWLPGFVLEEALRLGQVPGNCQGQSWLKKQKERLIKLWDTQRKGLSPHQENFIKRLLPYIEQHLGTVEDFLLKDNMESPYIHSHPDWTFNPEKLTSNYCLTIDFLSSLAFAILHYPYGFDWREIGSISRSLFGQVDRFDHMRDSLEIVVDSLFQEELSNLGLLSQGSIYSIYVAGNLSLEYKDGWIDSYLRPGIYSINNLQLEEINRISHKAKYILITNNKAILLKMYKSGFIKAYPGLLIISMEEKIRKAHHTLLQLVKGGDCKILIWLDTNSETQQIARQINRILPRANFILSHRNSKKETLSYENWLEWMEKNPIYGDKVQEFLIGEPTNWLQLFN